MNAAQRSRGNVLLIAERNSLSLRRNLGRLICRRSTASSWRSTNTSASVSEETPTSRRRKATSDRIHERVEHGTECYSPPVSTRIEFLCPTGSLRNRVLPERQPESPICDTRSKFRILRHSRARNRVSRVMSEIRGDKGRRSRHAIQSWTLEAARFHPNMTGTIEVA